MFGMMGNYGPLLAAAQQPGALPGAPGVTSHSPLGALMPVQPHMAGGMSAPPIPGGAGMQVQQQQNAMPAAFAQLLQAMRGGQGQGQPGQGLQGLFGGTPAAPPPSGPTMGQQVSGTMDGYLSALNQYLQPYGATGGSMMPMPGPGGLVGGGI